MTEPEGKNRGAPGSDVLPHLCGGGLTSVMAQGVAGVFVIVVLAANPANLLGLEELAAITLIAVGGGELYTVARRRESYRHYL